jgi:hypothetical protein
VALDQIKDADQDDAAGAGGFHDQLVTGLETGLAQCVNWQGCLVFAADVGVTSTPMLYFAHVE